MPGILIDEATGTAWLLEGEPNITLEDTSDPDHVPEDAWHWRLGRHTDSHVRLDVPGCPLRALDLTYFRGAWGWARSRDVEHSTGGMVVDPLPLEPGSVLQAGGVRLIFDCDGRAPGPRALLSAGLAAPAEQAALSRRLVEAYELSRRDPLRAAPLLLETARAALALESLLAESAALQLAACGREELMQSFVESVRTSAHDGSPAARWVAIRVLGAMFRGGFQPAQRVLETLSARGERAWVRGLCSRMLSPDFADPSPLGGAADATPMLLVALAEVSAGLDEVPLVVEVFGVSAAEARIRLASTRPAVITRAPYAEAAAIRARGEVVGLRTVSCDDRDVALVRDAPAAQRVELGDSSVRFVSREGPAVEIPYEELRMIVRASRVSRFGRELRPILPFGSMKVGRSAEDPRGEVFEDESVEHALLLFSRDACALVNQHTNFSNLGPTMQLSALANLQAISRSLRERAPRAVFDDRLVAMGRRRLAVADDLGATTADVICALLRVINLAG